MRNRCLSKFSYLLFLRFSLFLPFLLSLFMLSLMTACSDTEPYTGALPYIFIPPIEFVNPPTELQQEVGNGEHDVPPPEIPQFNEYLFDLDFEPETRMFSGMGSVRYTNRTGITLNEVVFRLYLNENSDNNHVRRPQTQGLNGFRPETNPGFMNILHVSQDNVEISFAVTDSVMTVYLPRPLEPDETISIRLQFEAYVPISALHTGANTKAVWGGMFLPTVAVFGDNGWHKESLHPIGNPFIMEVANYVVSITTPIGYIVAGTGVKTESYSEYEKTTTFVAHVTRDFAFAISPVFRQAMQTTPRGAEVHLYHYTENLPVDYILDIVVEAMAYFEENIGSYSYGQLRVVETNMFVNSINFSQVIFVDSFHLRHIGELDNLRQEVARQWFTGVVGHNPVTEAWLHEGLSLLLAEMSRSTNLRPLITESHRTLQMHHEAIPENVRRISTNINKYDNLADYRLIQQQKARLMFYVLLVEMGDENFMNLLREYYNQFPFKIATSQDFIQIAEEIQGESLSHFFDYWLNTTELPELPERRSGR